MDMYNFLVPFNIELYTWEELTPEDKRFCEKFPIDNDYLETIDLRSQLDDDIIIDLAKHGYTNYFASHTGTWTVVGIEDIKERPPYRVFICIQPNRRAEMIKLTFCKIIKLFE